MAAVTPTPSTSRRSRDPAQQEVEIGSFKRMEEIGRGSFATVYKATHTKRGGYVAIKSVNLSKLNKKLKDNLFCEIHILKELQHPHIVSLFDCRESSTHIHLIMEYCQMGDLSYFIKRRDQLHRNAYTADMVRKYPNPAAGGLHEVVVRHFLQQLASALEFLRNKNLIHRDVKPQNLLIIPSPLYHSKGRPESVPYVPNENSLIPVAGIGSLPMLKLADFGFARSLPSTSLAETLCGSPLYMAPEILRYEKYDAKADLWSVGTVTYEMMTGKAPFRASNHVELLRRIERGEDKIKFPDDVVVSDAMKKMIRGLLKRNPVERMGFTEFFDNSVTKDMIPGLVGDDLPKGPIEQRSVISTPEPMMRQPSGPRVGPPPADDAQLSHQERSRRTSAVRTVSARSGDSSPRQLTETPPDPSRSPRHNQDSDASDLFVEAPERLPRERRPVLPRGATAPINHTSHDAVGKRVPPSTVQRKVSLESPHQNTASKDGSQARARIERQNDDLRQTREAQERAAQDVMIEREYVVVEKRAVEINALADQLKANQGGTPPSKASEHATMVRRATTQATSVPAKGAQVTSSRALQIASGQRPEHRRQVSYERRVRSNTSTTSAISKAINLASGRLFSFGISPPLGLARGGPSPPLYSPFPAYPTTQGSLLLLGDGAKFSPLDEDSKAVQVIEEAATRSDVVYGFAEVKYKQLIPSAPSMGHGLGLRAVGIPEKDESGVVPDDDGGLTPDAIVTLSEEALVLYVKALSLLAQAMDVAGAWWARKNCGEVIDESTSPKSIATPAHNAAAGNRINNVVQWVRSRFNEVLEKAEFVRLKLIEAQKRLPSDHPSHPSNHPTSSTSSTGLGSSAENVVVSPGVSAEKLMYLRALEMSRSAAVNELVCDDLPGCEIAYVTAIRMLEAVLEDDDEIGPKRLLASDKDASYGKAEGDDFNLVNPEDRESVMKLVQSIRGRLAALRKKLHIMAKRSSAPPVVAPTKSVVTATVSPTLAVAGTPPR
ncbi:Serine/threonine-protein kinase [Xylographa vitiligo]|nr:Serine/threonine-protein kinase [Xylographa vitiligo]